MLGPGPGPAEAGCPEEEELLRHLQREPTDPRAEAIEAHIDRCRSCRAVLVALARCLPQAGSEGSEGSEGGGGEGSEGGWAPPGREAGRLERGTTLGRYVVLDLLGAGGMGLVYSAYDPDLDRQIALKLLRSSSSGESPERSIRLQREARAMAQVSHPNVIRVFDVGDFEGQVFIAMELIHGQTLGRWLTAAPRRRREILQVFVGAGRGLAAAHAAGLVHRDFKPDNVLIDRDGRALVTDFGLVRTLEEVEGPGVPQRTSRAAEVRLTRTGALLGTPAYMAPEQHMRRAVDPQADQFAFCVALYEALYGERPFAGETAEALARAAALGLVQPPTTARVPAWQRAVILRGLAPTPEARHPSMEALLEALTRDPAAAWRRRAGWGAAAVGLVVVGVMAHHVSSPPHHPGQRCAGGARARSAAWGAAGRARVEGAFLAADPARGAEVFEGVATSLAEYATRWAAMYRDACAATRLRGEQSEELLARRLVCLETRKAEFAALARHLTEADAEAVLQARAAAGQLSPIEPCGDVAALAQAPRLPASLEARGEAEVITSRLAEARALTALGKPREAIEAAERARARAEALGHVPLEAEVLLTLGRAQGRARDLQAAQRTLLRAVDRAEAGHLDDVRAEALLELVHALGRDPERRREAHRVGRITLGALERAGKREAALELLALLEQLRKEP